YVTLTKPRIMSLLLLTGAAGAFAGAHGRPSLAVVALTLGGLALACGGASALNHVLDRDIDRLMGSRTRERPGAAARVPASRALLIEPDYAAAQIPMLPVVRGTRETTRQIVLYSLALVAFSLLPLAWGQFGIAYALAAAALGAWLLRLALALRRDPTRRRAAF